MTLRVLSDLIIDRDSECVCCGAVPCLGAACCCPPLTGGSGNWDCCAEEETTCLLLTIDGCDTVVMTGSNKCTFDPDVGQSDISWGGTTSFDDPDFTGTQQCNGDGVSGGPFTITWQLKCSAGGLFVRWFFSSECSPEVLNPIDPLLPHIRKCGALEGELGNPSTFDSGWFGSIPYYCCNFEATDTIDASPCDCCCLNQQPTAGRTITIERCGTGTP